jgi:hypothetical protein
MGDPYNTIVIYRNAGFQLPVNFQTSAKYGIDVSSYYFGFMIAPTQLDGSFGPPAIINTTPVVVEPGLATFTLSAAQTASLVWGTAYHYAVTHKVSGQERAVDQIGRVKLVDAPPYP